MDQPQESEVCDEACCRISSPSRIPPSFTDEGPQPTLYPPVQPMEQLSDIRFPVIVPPAAYDRVDHLDHVPQRHRRSSLRQVADLILEPGHRLFARHGVEVVRIGLAGPLGGGHPQTLSAFDLIAEELEPMIDMNDPGLLRMEANPKFVAQE